MPQVPWIRLYVSFFTHKKTMRMRRELGTVEPILRLWVWAAENAQDGDLGGISDDDLEEAMGWRGRRGKAIACARDCGFIDGTRLHGWEEKTGAGIESLTRTRKLTADRQQRYRERTSNALPNEKETQTVASNETRPEQQRRDDRRGEESRDPDPTHTSAHACDPTEHVVPAQAPNEPGKPTAWAVVSKYLAIRTQVLGAAGRSDKLFAQPAQSEIDKASPWIDSMTTEETEDIEPGIRLACKHVLDGAQGWTHPAITKTGFLLGAIVQNWRDLREELHGCAPVVKPKAAASARVEAQPRRSTPVKEW